MFSNIDDTESAKTIEEYMNDYPTFLLSDLETVKKSIFESKRYITAVLPSAKKIRMKTSRSSILNNNWEDIPNIILGIRDNDQLINTLNTCKRQKLGLGYIFIESLQYISVIIKKPNSYPLIIIRIPIERPFIYADNNMKGIFFEFPLEQIIVKENSTKSKNKQYKMYLTKENGYMITLEVMSGDNIKKRVIDNVKQCDNIIINELLKSSMLSYLSKFRLDRVNDLAYSLSNMNIIIMKKLQNNQVPINFDTLQNKQTAYLHLDDDKLNFVIKGVDKKDEQVILTKDNTDYWTSIDYSGNYIIHTYDTMFKISHYNMGTSKDSNYYLLTTFQNTFMFIKLVSDQNVNINDDNNHIFQEIFNKGTNVLEMYLLIQDNDNIE